MHWDELNSTALNAQYYTIDTIFKQLETRDDPWQGFDKNAKAIDATINTMEILVN